MRIDLTLNLPCSGLPRHSQLAAHDMLVLEHQPATERTRGMLQPPPCLQLDPPLHYHYLPGVHDRILAFVYVR